jgi:hypothetical protein
VSFAAITLCVALKSVETTGIFIPIGNSEILFATV